MTFLGRASTTEDETGFRVLLRGCTTYDHDQHTNGRCPRREQTLRTRARLAERRGSSAGKFARSSFEVAGFVWRMPGKLGSLVPARVVATEGFALAGDPLGELRP